ncbi:hypothetical protein LJ655_18470 [Paraburkholderia sp. MMS20-SJTN17]|uniref:Uncharacterized protein n=1 Tax=Paraburkholderia translucens TaxID=2886945 RepID=A0ABS8KGE4_9BURK|nr:hypothetical protein [Paraburkholderia sp. MMS20-SJTN17]MCC8403851.1 hypothetical protein [Paraburkholderia sp. MMS20-SJTN17]
MISTPLTLIEGAFALPRLRPLASLPEPFGRDWALLPFGERWRTGLGSLYAALLRTVCVNDRHLLSYGQWVSIDGVLIGVRQKAAQPVETAAQPAGEPANTAASVHAAMQRRVPQGPMRIALKPRTPRIARRRTVWNRRAVAASACAIGCVAVLAWWMADQPLAPRRMAFDTLKSVQALAARRDVPVEERRSQDQSARLEAPVMAEAVAPASVLPPSPAHVAAAAPASALPQPTATRRNPAWSEGTHSDPPRPVLRAQTHPQRANRYAKKRSEHAVRAGADEYAELTTSAMMPWRDAAPLPRRVVSNNLTANGSEWMNHMSQRRVTEIPEQFAR